MPTLIAALHDTAMPVRRATAKALGNMGADAIPALAKIFADGPSLDRPAAPEKPQPNAAAVPADKSGDKAAASQSAAIKQPDVAAPQPKKAPTVNDPTARLAAVWALSNFGTDAIPVLEKALRDSNVQVRETAALSLANTSPNAIPVLKRALDDEDWTVRLAAVRALGTMGPEAIPALQKALSDSYGRVQRGAGRAMAKIGWKMEPVETRDEVLTSNR
jgi:HEAT repeat protein